jgi:Flp pilus assembly pilin Flp
MDRREAGQGLVEYYLILVLIAMVVNLIFDVLGPSIQLALCELFADLAPDLMPAACATLGF